VQQRAQVFRRFTSERPEPAQRAGRGDPDPGHRVAERPAERRHRTGLRPGTHRAGEPVTVQRLRQPIDALDTRRRIAVRQPGPEPRQRGFQVRLRHLHRRRLGVPPREELAHSGHRQQAPSHDQRAVEQRPEPLVRATHRRGQRPLLRLAIPTRSSSPPISPKPPWYSRSNPTIVRLRTRPAGELFSTFARAFPSPFRLLIGEGLAAHDAALLAGARRNDQGSSRKGDIARPSGSVRLSCRAPARIERTVRLPGRQLAGTSLLPKRPEDMVMLLSGGGVLPCPPVRYCAPAFVDGQRMSRPR
jgi:hypothetical protein